jgi:hypothetical protein
MIKRSVVKDDTWLYLWMIHNQQLGMTQIYISSGPFTPCGAQGIHEEFPVNTISSYPLDLIA